ncbi:MAG: hypothetical protein RL299_1838 [Pseudomonadota bacterium]
MRFALKPVLAVAVLALAAPGLAMPESAEANFKAAKNALGRGDGIAAEVELQRAAKSGASRAELSASMGEALIAQGEWDKAREWLASGQFAKGEEAYGWRMLGMLERLQGNLPAAGKALDQALAKAPKDPLLWVEIGRLRYVGGEHLQAIDAAERALAADPENVRALEFRAQLLRDAAGPLAALPLYEQALAIAPKDLDVLGGYAAALGEAGRAEQMLVVTRRMLAQDARNLQAFYLQAVLAARAGNADLGRAMLNRIGDKLDDMPAALLLAGALELQAGNANVAARKLALLVERQPANQQAQLLLARALYESGDYNQLFARFWGLAQRSDASPYLLTVLGRALEDRADYLTAAEFLDRAAVAVDHPLQPIAAPAPGELAARWSANPAAPGWAVPYVRSLLASNNLAGASSAAQRFIELRPGSAEALGLVGDVALAQGAAQPALERYTVSARVRFPAQMLPRIAGAYQRLGQDGMVQPLAAQYLAAFPRSVIALRMAANQAALAGDWAGARAILENLVKRGGGGDWRLLCDLSLAQLRSGDAKAASESARKAWRLQPASALTNQAYGMALAEAGSDAGLARQVLEAARRIGGDNPLLAAARKKLK